MSKCMSIDTLRRLVLAAAGALTVLVLPAATPAQARDAREGYPWCARIEDYGGALECAYMNLRQCLATVSGVGGDCVINPFLLRIPEEYPVRKHRKRPRR